MNPEDGFHAALDADPEDWQTRLVLADYLQDLCPRPCPRSLGKTPLCVGGRVALQPDGLPCVSCGGAGQLFTPDPRIEGYRAMGALRLFPHRFTDAVLDRVWWQWKETASGKPHDCYLKPPWVAIIRHNLYEATARATVAVRAPRFDTRREADDAAALAWLGLPDTYRAALLCSS